MTPEKKAKELVGTFSHPDAAVWVAKQHALLAVNEILSVTDEIVTLDWHDDSPNEKSIYWTQVRNEIDKL